MRVMIVDDHPVTRDGLRSALSAATEIEIVGEAGSGDEAVTLAKEVEPDLLFMDVQMPGMDGLQAAKQIRADRPDTKVILFTEEESTEGVAEALQAGMSGYLLKNMTPDELIHAARLAMEGKAVIHPALTRTFFDLSRLRPARAETPLSSGESEILQSVAHGNTTPWPDSVRAELQHIFENLPSGARSAGLRRRLRRRLRSRGGRPVGLE